MSPKNYNDEDSSDDDADKKIVNIIETQTARLQKQKQFEIKF